MVGSSYLVTSGSLILGSILSCSWCFLIWYPLDYMSMGCGLPKYPYFSIPGLPAFSFRFFRSYFPSNIFFENSVVRFFNNSWLEFNLISSSWSLSRVLLVALLMGSDILSLHIWYVFDLAAVMSVMSIQRKVLKKKI